MRRFNMTSRLLPLISFIVSAAASAADGHNSLVTQTSIGPGAECVNGGTLVSSGVDDGAAAATVDQTMTATNNGGANVGDGQKIAQTFSAGATGLLESVSLLLSPGQGRCFDDNSVVPVPDLIISIEETTAGAPNGSVLATQAFSAAETSVANYAFEAPPTVQAGTVYAIVIATTASAASACVDFNPGSYGSRSFTFGPDFLNNEPDC